MVDELIWWVVFGGAAVFWFACGLELLEEIILDMKWLESVRRRKKRN